MAGFDAPYVPGYDCHGLPIELKVDRELGPKKRDMSMAEIRRACRAYAERFIGVMTDGVQAPRWSSATGTHPYLTMNFRYQADIARALGKFVERGLVYKGKKPVHWCIHCRTALAEAEVEYQDHTSPSIYVEFPLRPDERRRARRARAGAGRPRGLGPDLDDDAVDDSVEPGDRVPPRVRLRAPTRSTAGPSSSPRALAERVAPGRRHARSDRAGRADEGRRSSKASASAIRSTTATRSACSGDYVTLEQGTGAVHTAPGHGADDFLTGRQVRPRDLRAGRTRRALPRHGRAVRRPAGVRRQPERRAGAARARAGSGIARRSRTSTRTAGAATTR